MLEPETALCGAVHVDRHATVTDRAALDRGGMAGMRLGEADLAPRAVDLDFALGHVGDRHEGRVPKGGGGRQGMVDAGA